MSFANLKKNKRIEKIKKKYSETEPLRFQDIEMYSDYVGHGPSGGYERRKKLWGNA